MLPMMKMRSMMKKNDGLIILLIGVPSFPKKGGACLCSGKDKQRLSEMGCKLRSYLAPINVNR